MIKKDDIRLVLESVKGDFPDATEKDVVFVALCDVFQDKQFAYYMAYKKYNVQAASFYREDKMVKLIAALEPFGLGVVDKKKLTKEENKQELINLIDRTERLMDTGDIEEKDGLKIIGDLRVKLNDKFEMEESQKQKRIIIVPSKHDLICQSTGRECTYFPTKAACMKKYNLIEKTEDYDNEQDETADN